MNISSVAQPTYSQGVTSFRMDKTSEPDKIPEEKIADTQKELEESKGKYSPFKSIVFKIEMAINKSSRFLNDGLHKIFDDGEKLLAGRNSAEYDKHIKALSEAIEDQDYKNAEKIIDRFFSGDTEKIVSRVKSLAKSAEENFWKGVDDALAFLDDDGALFKLLDEDGNLSDEMTMLEIANIALNTSREEVDPFSERDFSAPIKSIRAAAVEEAKGGFKNAGQNKYSEDATSITHAATEYSIDKVFNTDDRSYEEDDKILVDLYTLEEDALITKDDEKRLTHQNSRKGDSFTKFMRGRSEKFLDEFSKLEERAILVKEGEKPELPKDEAVGDEAGISVSLLASSQQIQTQMELPELTDILELELNEQHSNQYTKDKKTTKSCRMITHWNAKYSL